jgi:hypothetical protein
MKIPSVAVLGLLLASVLTATAEAPDTVQTRAGIEKRIKTDLRMLKKAVDGANISGAEQERLRSEVERLSEAFANSQLDIPADFKAILPVTPLHARLFELRAALWRAKGHDAITVWNADLWGHLDLWDDLDVAAEPAVRVHMMLNEHRAGVFNVTNAGKDAAEMKLRVMGLPGGPNPGYITVHQVEWTDTRPGKVVAAALPEAPLEEDAYALTLPSGMTRQVWLTFHSVNVPPGTHQGQIEVRIGEQTFHVPLELKVYPLQFPDQPTLHSGGWDYTSSPGVYGVTEENIEAFLEHCRERFVDSPWARRRVIPLGQHDEKGNIVSTPNTEVFDAWIARWPEARRLCIFQNVGESLAGFELGTPEFQTALNDYLRFWAGHAKTKGFEPEQISMLLIDEPIDIETDRRIVEWAKAYRAADTGIQVWEDPIHPDMSRAHPELGTACHILCLNRTMFQRAPEKYGRYFMEAREKGATLEFYSCRGPARLLDPYAYYRMQAWSCWRQKAISTNFWAYGDNAGTTSWNEYIAPRTAYTPFFIDAEIVIAGKHMEACREGIQDHEYLVMLDRAVTAAEEEGRTDQAVTSARVLLDELPDRVLNDEVFEGFWWRDDLDRTGADAARLEILDALIALE